MSNRFQGPTHQKSNTSVIAAQLEPEARKMMTNLHNGALMGITYQRLVGGRTRLGLVGP